MTFLNFLKIMYQYPPSQNFFFSEWANPYLTSRHYFIYLITHFFSNYSLATFDLLHIFGWNSKIHSPLVVRMICKSSHLPKQAIFPVLALLLCRNRRSSLTSWSSCPPSSSYQLLRSNLWFCYFVDPKSFHYFFLLMYICPTFKYGNLSTCYNAF